MIADLCSILFVLAIVGILVALIRGIWLLTASIGRPGHGSSSDRFAGKNLRKCARCGRSLLSGNLRCPNCGLGSDSALSDELTDLAATRRQLDRFRLKGGVSGELLDQVFDAVVRRQQVLLGRESPAPAPPAVPVPAAPIPLAPVLLATRAVEVPLAKTNATDDVLDVIPVLEAANEPGRLKSPRPVSLPSARVELPPPVPPPPRRSVGEVLSAFMEERNILWGELIGGLLIVGCSIALVISLWQQLEQVPYFPFLVLGGITAALIGAGLYTLHHWKLESTSRGLLVIGSLLVPLSFMVLAGLARGPEANRLLEISVTAVSLGLFAFLLQRAGRILVPEQNALLPLAVLGAAASQLLVPWVLAKHQPVLVPILLLGTLPMLCQAITTALALRHASRRDPIEPANLNALFGLVGMATFSLAVALGFLVYWNENLVFALQRLAVVTAAGSIAPLVCGAWAYRRLTGDPRLATARTIGTAIALAGAFVMLVAVVLAWPRPLALVVVCGLNFAVLTVVAFCYRMSGVHAVALLCAALGYLTACHALAGHLTESSGLALLQELGSAQSGTMLAVLVIVLGVTAEWLARTGQRQSAACYALGSGAIALLSLALVSVRGLADPVQPLTIYALYGAGTLALNDRWRRPGANYLGLGLLVGATLWGLQWQAPGQPVFLGLLLPASWGLVLAMEAAILGFCSVYFTFQRSANPGEDSAVAAPDWGPILAAACRDTAAMVAILALATASLTPEFPGPALQACTLGVLAAAALCLAYSYRREYLTWIGSLLLFASLIHAFAWNAADRPLPRSWAFALLAHTTLVLFTSLALRVARTVRPFPTPTEISDRIYHLITLPLGLTALASSACVWTWVLASLVGSFDLPAPGIEGPAYSLAAPWWTFAPGGTLGWLGLALSAAALAYRGQRQESSASLAAMGGAGLILVAFVALGMMRGLSPMAGYRTLMVGSAAYALGLTLAGMARVWRAGTPVEMSATTAGWVRLGGLLAVVLGIKTAVLHQDHLWAAGAITLASTAGAIAAIGRRREEWAFAAGLGFDLAASFLVWHFNRADPAQ